MNLRNKKSGKIVRVEFLSNWQTDDGTEIGFRECNTNIVYSYNSLAELNNEWEDYKDPVQLYFIDFQGIIHCAEPKDYNWTLLKTIGNCFRTKEEAEKAVEKLKAWKRLKDGGITFKNWTINQTGTIDCFATWGDNIPPSRKNPTLLDDLDLLFGGVE